MYLYASKQSPSNNFVSPFLGHNSISHLTLSVISWTWVRLWSSHKYFPRSRKMTRRFDRPTWCFIPIWCTWQCYFVRRLESLRRRSEWQLRWSHCLAILTTISLYSNSIDDWFLINYDHQKSVVSWIMLTDRPNAFILSCLCRSQPPLVEPMHGELEKELPYRLEFE